MNCPARPQPQEFPEVERRGVVPGVFEIARGFRAVRAVGGVHCFDSPCCKFWNRKALRGLAGSAGSLVGKLSPNCRRSPGMLASGAEDSGSVVRMPFGKFAASRSTRSRRITSGGS